MLLCPGGGGGGFSLDRVELPLEVWVLTESIEGGLFGPRKESNGAGRLIPVSQNSRYAVTSTRQTWYDIQAQEHKAGYGPFPIQQCTNRVFKNCGLKKRNYNTGECVLSRNKIPINMERSCL